MDLFYIIDPGYSYETSLPAYKESGKEVQAERIKNLVRTGCDNLLKLSELTGLPQSTVAGRVNDLIEMGVVEYSGVTVYKDRKRKKITLKIAA